MASIWREGAELPEFEALSGDLDTDVLIIGGGLVGLLCARMLQAEGVDYALIEAERICGGVTANSTAKVTSQHGLVYDKLIRRLGAGRARLYLRANEEALDKYRALCRDIDCGFEERDNYVYSLDDRRKLDKELSALCRLGYPARLAESLPLPFPVAGAVEFPRQAQLDPLRFAAGIAKGLRIYEGSKVRELVGMTAVTPGGRIRARRIIIATHYPILNKHGWYFLKLYQHRSYVLALENAPDVKGMYVDENDKGLSFRNYRGCLLLGGGGHRTGKKGGGWRELEAFAARYYPEAREKCRWAAQDCMSLDGAPYIGQYSPATPELYVASGFNKWGLSSSMVAATILTDLVRGRENAFAPAFDPSRSVMRPQLAMNVLDSALGLLTPTAPRCPHLGCALKWNAAERSWDCPCHGSRFAEDGRLLNDPATGDLEYKR